ncbi:MAG: hypothetical protein H5T69_19740, partial [Chloroflexi bacterium]|nr:hypothetical protein [Chloroflexota bacterium]
VRVLPLSDEGEGFRPLDQTLTLFALGVGGLLACQGEGAVRIETDALRITIQGKGASIKLEHKDDAFALAELLPLIGPPYWPSEFGKSGFSMSLIRQNERVIVRLAGEARWQKGLFLLLDVQVSAAGVILVEAQLENRGPEPLCKRLRFSLNRPDEEGLFALALPQGIVESALPDYPTVRDDAPLDPSAYAEPWLAWQRGGAVAGVAWDEHIARVDAPWRTSLTTREVEIAAGGRSEPVRLMLYGGDGDWHCVRRAALRWSAGTVRATTRPSHPPYGVEADPGVVLTLDNEVALQVVADAASVLPERGQVCVETSAGLRAAPSLLAIEELKRGEPLRRSIRLQMGPPGAYGGHLHLDLGLREHTAPFHVLRLGKPSPVEVYSGQREGQEV